MMTSHRVCADGSSTLCALYAATSVASRSWSLSQLPASLYSPLWHPSPLPSSLLPCCHCIVCSLLTVELLPQCPLFYLHRVEGLRRVFCCGLGLGLRRCGGRRLTALRLGVCWIFRTSHYCRIRQAKHGPAGPTPVTIAQGCLHGAWTSLAAVWQTARVYETRAEEPCSPLCTYADCCNSGHEYVCQMSDPLCYICWPIADVTVLLSCGCDTLENLLAFFFIYISVAQMIPCLQ